MLEIIVGVWLATRNDRPIRPVEGATRVEPQPKPEYTGPPRTIAEASARVRARP